MPYINITTSAEIAAAQQEPFLAAVSKAAADATGKPERYMMVSLQKGTFLLAGQPGPTAYVDVRAIGGLTPAVNGKLSAQLGAVIGQWLKVPGERVYLTFTDYPPSNWGHNGKTFG